MSTLLEAFSRQLDARPVPADIEARRVALAAAVESDLPHGRVEEWKYTSLRAVERRAPSAALPVALDASVLAQVPSPRVVFVNGRYSPDASDLADLPAGLALSVESATLPFELIGAAHAFNQVNAALSEGGVRIAVSGEVKTPLHIAWIQAGDEASDVSQHNTHAITLERAASLNLVEHVVSGGEHKHLSTNRLVVSLANGARMEHVRFQRDAAAATWFARTEVTLGAHADYRRLDLELGSSLTRHELNYTLVGEGAHVLSNGVLLGDGKRHLDTRLDILHNAVNTSCELNWRGLGAERSRIAFHGSIIIAEGADFTEAALSNRNLLLSENAEIDTQPVLEIYADEVQAAHGATVGQLDLNSLFYLRSRGIDAQAAKTMLIAAFVHELLTVVGDSSLRGWLGGELDAALQGLDLA